MTSHPLRRPIAMVLAVSLLLAGAPGAVFAAPVASPATAATAPASGPASYGAEPRASAPATPSLELTASPPVSALETTPVALPVVRIQDDEPAVRFTGSWNHSASDAMSGGSARVSRTAGSEAVVAFNGTGVAWVTQVGPEHGQVRVYLDGVATATVSTYATSHASAQQAWGVSGLPDGRHTLAVRVLNSKVASSTNTYVFTDAFDIEGTLAGLGSMPGVRVQNGDSRLYQKGAWSTLSTPTAWGGSLVRTWQSGAAITTRFKGSQVTWLGRKDLGGGKAEVWLDGHRVATVSQYATAGAEHRVVWASSRLPYGVHNVTIKALRSASTTSGGTRTDMDAMQVVGTPLQALRPTPFTYPWRTYIVIDKSDFKLYWVRNGILVKTYPIAHGKPSTPTPSRVWRIDAKYYTDPSGVYGPRKMRLFKQVRTTHGYVYVFTAYGIHGTNQPWVIGTQASHGCIRMYNRDVLELWPQVPLGTMVVTRD